jgi:hypothetical protein
MTARRPRERHPDSRWLIGIAEIASYSGDDINRVNRALIDGSLVGWQQPTKTGSKGRWKSLPECVDAWIKGEPYMPEVPRVARRAS